MVVGAGHQEREPREQRMFFWGHWTMISLDFGCVELIAYEIPR